MAEPPRLAGSRPATEQTPTTELLRMTRAGDDRSTRLLCSRLEATLRRCVSGRLPTKGRSIQDTDDIVQEVLATTMQRLPQINAVEARAFYAYVWNVVRSKIADAHRRSSREGAQQTMPPHLEDTGPTPLEALIGKEAFTRYERALEQLSPDQQQAVVGRLEFGLSFAEIAGAMDKTSADAARMVVNRALVQLARTMDE